MLTFTGMALDRASELRTDPRWVSQRRADPASCTVLSPSEGVHGRPARLAPPAPFLQRLGAPTVAAPAGALRVCKRSGTEHFPGPIPP